MWRAGASRASVPKKIPARQTELSRPSEQIRSIRALFRSIRVQASVFTPPTWMPGEADASVSEAETARHNHGKPHQRNDTAIRKET